MPACYGVGGGTSSATAFTAGAIALLISAANQSHISYDAESLYWAVRMRARRLAGVGVSRQGNGLLQVEAAWTLLQAAATGSVDVSGVAVDYVEVISAVDNRDAELAPLRDMSNLVTGDFLPVPAGVGVDSNVTRQSQMRAQDASPR